MIASDQVASDVMCAWPAAVLPGCRIERWEEDVGLILAKYVGSVVRLIAEIEGPSKAHFELLESTVMWILVM